MFKYVERQVPRQVKSSLGFLHWSLVRVLSNSWKRHFIMYSDPIGSLELYIVIWAVAYRTNSAFHNSSARVNA